MKILTSFLIILTLTVEIENIIFDFNNNSNLTRWNVVDDGVMGGLSQGNIVINGEGHAVYSGFVTTDNNGGFSSVRHNFNSKDVSNYNHVVLKLKGDGKPYQFRIKENQSQRFSYVHTFETNGEWEIIKIPFKDFYPSFRGYKLNKPNFNGGMMEEIAILIGNKKKEDFILIIDSISLE